MVQTGDRFMSMSDGLFRVNTWVKLADRTILISRLVAATTLGRPLRRDEYVHHVDGNKQNNSPDNLMVLSRGGHARIHSKYSSPEEHRLARNAQQRSRRAANPELHRSRNRRYYQQRLLRSRQV
jgi:hypothetical protein